CAPIHCAHIRDVTDSPPRGPSGKARAGEAKVGRESRRPRPCPGRVVATEVRAGGSCFAGLLGLTGREGGGAADDALVLAHLVLDLDGELGVFFQVFADIVLALADTSAAVAVPGAGLVDHAGLY